MNLSICICTYNRAEMLRSTINSINTKISYFNLVEVNIIDNCSNDSTKNTVVELQNFNLNLNYFYCSIPGLSNARNYAIQISKFDNILFLDDDVELFDDFLKGYYYALLDFPDGDVFGGEIIVKFLDLIKKPWFLSDFFLKDFGQQKFSNKTQHVKYLNGGNLLFRCLRIKNNLVFDPNLGRNGRSLNGGEEIALLDNLSNYGSVFYGIKDSGLYHLIPSNRVKISNILKIYKNYAKQYSRSIINENKSYKFIILSLFRNMVNIRKDIMDYDNKFFPCLVLVFYYIYRDFLLVKNKIFYGPKFSM